MKIRPFQPDDKPELLRLAMTLFPDCTPEEYEREWNGHGSMGAVGGVPGCIFVVDRGSGNLGGFVEVTLRNVVDGCSSTPVGYLEALYVDEDLRRRGLARALIAAAEQWARQQGCSEMGSDCVVSNEVSFKTHRAAGFEEVDRCINFRKQLSPLAAAVPGAEDWISLFDTPLTVARMIEHVKDTRAGGIDVFLGTTREEKSSEGRELIALDYEAYEQMALEQMRALAKRAREKWPIIKLALLHRTGRVALGEPSVVIAVSTPHRAQAFEACRFLIDELKRDIAIWKKEVWADGSSSWVHPGSSTPAPSGRGN